MSKRDFNGTLILYLRSVHPGINLAYDYALFNTMHRYSPKNVRHFYNQYVYNLIYILRISVHNVAHKQICSRREAPRISVTS